MPRAPRPDFLVIGAPKAGTTALHAALAQHPDVFVSRPEGAEVLAVRRRAAARLARAGRQALAAGVDLARRPLLPALRPGGAAPGARREHAVLPVEPRRPPPHRRGPARRAPRRRGPRPDGPRLQQLDAPVVRRAGAGGGLRVGVRPRGRAGRAPAGRRSGATASSGSYGEQLAAPAPLRRPRPGSSSSATATWSTSPARRSTGSAGSSGSGRDWSTRSRATTRAASSPPGWRPRLFGPVVRGGARLGQFAPPRGVAARSTRCRSACWATTATRTVPASTRSAGSG